MHGDLGRKGIIRGVIPRGLNAESVGEEGSRPNIDRTTYVKYITQPTLLITMHMATEFPNRKGSSSADLRSTSRARTQPESHPWLNS